MYILLYLTLLIPILITCFFTVREIKLTREFEVFKRGHKTVFKPKTANYNQDDEQFIKMAESLGYNNSETQSDLMFQMALEDEKI